MVAIDLRARSPQQFAAMIAAKLGSLGIGSSSSSGEVGRRPPGGIPVNETDLRRLGVHAAISVLGRGDLDELRTRADAGDESAAGS
jgi:hypothetical protein